MESNQNALQVERSRTAIAGDVIDNYVGTRMATGRATGLKFPQGRVKLP